MRNLGKMPTRFARWLTPIALAAAAVALSGCRTMSFYAQAIKGQCQLLAREEATADLLVRADTSERLRRRLELLQELREFAERDLGLHVDGQYAKYADLGRRYVVWNVQAAPEFSLESKTWWYPLVGRLDYRGYFSQDAATRYAAFLERKGYDVFVGGVEAYSTLGWFKDPALNTFLFNPDADLAETIFHELAHQRVFAPGDTDFNEAFATMVGEEGTLRWLEAHGQPQAVTEYQVYLQRNRQFVDLVMRTRGHLENLYGDTRTDAGDLKASRDQPHRPVQVLREGKRRILADFRRECERLQTTWNTGGAFRFDPSWLSDRVNNAQLNSVAAYYDLVPAFKQLLAANGGQWESFYGAAKRLAKMPELQRHQELRRLAGEP